MIGNVKEFLGTLLKVVLSALIAAALPLLTGGAALGNTVGWDGGGGNNLWSTPANWDNDTVPAPTDDVLIVMPGTYTVVLDVDVIVASLALGDEIGTQTLFMRDRMLTLNGVSTVASGAVLDVTGLPGPGSRIEGSGPLMNAGTLNLSNGSVVNVPLTNDGTMAVFGNNLVPDASLNGAFANHGTLAIHALPGGITRHARLFVASGFDNNGQIVMNSIHGGTVTLALSSGFS